MDISLQGSAQMLVDTGPVKINLESRYNQSTINALFNRQDISLKEVLTRFGIHSLREAFGDIDKSFRLNDTIFNQAYYLCSYYPFKGIEVSIYGTLDSKTSLSVKGTYLVVQQYMSPVAKVAILSKLTKMEYKKLVGQIPVLNKFKGTPILEVYGDSVLLGFASEDFEGLKHVSLQEEFDNFTSNEKFLTQGTQVLYRNPFILEEKSKRKLRQPSEGIDYPDEAFENAYRNKMKERLKEMSGAKPDKPAVDDKAPNEQNQEKETPVDEDSAKKPKPAPEEDAVVTPNKTGSENQVSLKETNVPSVFEDKSSKQDQAPIENVKEKGKSEDEIKTSDKTNKTEKPKDETKSSDKTNNTEKAQDDKALNNKSMTAPFKTDITGKTEKSQDDKASNNKSMTAPFKTDITGKTEKSQDEKSSNDASMTAPIKIGRKLLIPSNSDESISFQRNVLPLTDQDRVYQSIPGQMDPWTVSSNLIDESNKPNGNIERMGKITIGSRISF